MLRDAGKRGVRSDEFIRNYLPRGCARVYDLRKEGHKIRAERQGKYTRFWLVGVGGESGAAHVDASALGHSSDPGGQPATPEHSGPQAAGRALPGASPSSQPAPEPLFQDAESNRPLSAFTDAGAA